MNKSIKGNLIVVVAVFLSFCFTGAAKADDVGLGKIVVTPSRIEQDSFDATSKVDVITSSQFSSNASGDIVESLTVLVSLNLSDYGSFGAEKNIRMRGSSASQVLVMADGRPLNNPRDGQVDLNTIGLDNINKIEVVRGPSSSLYGASSMGGTVNIITKRPPAEGQKTELSTYLGTYRTYVEQLSHGGKTGHFGYIVSSGYKDQEGFRDNSEFISKDLNAKFEYDLNPENLLTLNSGLFKSKAGSPGTITLPDIDDTQLNRKNFIDASWGFKSAEDTALSAKTYNNYDRLEFAENSAGSIFDTADSKAVHTTKARGYDAQFNKRLTDNDQIVLGFNHVSNFNNSTSTAKHRYIVRACYGENQLDLTQQFKLTLGGRFDDYSNFGTEFNPSAGILYRLRDSLKLRMLCSRSFRAPTFNDLYWPDEGWAKGNPNLNPEKGITAEFGIDAQITSFLSSGLTYYRNDFNDLINWGEEAGVWTPKNVNSAVMDGIEFENALTLAENLRMIANYTFLRAIDDKTNKYLVYQPKHKVDLSLKCAPLKGFNFEVKGQFTDKRFHDPENTVKVKRFYVYGVNASRKFENGLTCFTSVDNILNRKYQVIKDYPMQGFSVTGGVKVEF